MSKLYFLGGENTFRRDAKEVNARAFLDAGGNPNVLLFSWARASFDYSFKRRKRLEVYFRSLGADSVVFPDYSDSPEKIAEMLRGSDLVYLTGGQVSILSSRLRSKGVDRQLKDYNGVIFGRSAGALIMGSSCLVTNRYSGSRKVVKGIGLVDFSVKVHYEPWQDKILREFSKNRCVYAISQGSALVFESGALSHIGDVFVFKDGERSKL